MDYEGFKKEILAMSSIDLNCYKEKQMKRRIDSLIAKNGYSGYSDYIPALKSNKTLYNEFINYLTINVSEFYRNPEQWNVLEKEVLPMLMQKTKKLKIWSAACSTGDEPYTLVMVLNKFMPLSSIKIYATDIDKGALEKAMLGNYSLKSVENLPAPYLEKYFIKSGDTYTIKNEVKNCVEFKQHNLLKDPYPTDCDLIVCRNVLIYFTEEAKSQIYKKFNNSLKDEGILFVGSTEQIILSNKYNFRPIKTFFYIKEKQL
ncbi:MAG: protein-glutamate O-methyltransferase CheR [Clostridia bacterium]|nr:protein-glutamate O-methyltransferase CheR [Clostridia bacterium]